MLALSVVVVRPTVAAVFLSVVDAPILCCVLQITLSV